MKKIFILTGEPSGDKLASTVISKLQQDHSDIKYLSVGGSHLNKLGIKSIYDLKEVTYIGFTSVILNLFKIRNKINETVKKMLDNYDKLLYIIDNSRKVYDELYSAHNFCKYWYDFFSNLSGVDSE